MLASQRSFQSGTHEVWLINWLIYLASITAKSEGPLLLFHGGHLIHLRRYFKARALGFKMRQGAWIKLQEGIDCFLLSFVFPVPDIETQCWFWMNARSVILEIMWSEKAWFGVPIEFDLWEFKLQSVIICVEQDGIRWLDCECERENLSIRAFAWHLLLDSEFMFLLALWIRSIVVCDLSDKCFPQLLANGNCFSLFSSTVLLNLY